MGWKAVPCLEPPSIMAWLAVCVQDRTRTSPHLYSYYFSLPWACSTQPSAPTEPEKRGDLWHEQSPHSCVRAGQSLPAATGGCAGARKMERWHRGAWENKGSFNGRRWKVGEKRKERNEDGQGKDEWVSKRWDEGMARAEGNKPEGV